jgi:hypothetical protein
VAASVGGIVASEFGRAGVEKIGHRREVNLRRTFSIADRVHLGDYRIASGIPTALSGQNVGDLHLLPFRSRNGPP